MRRFLCISLVVLTQCVKPDVSNPNSVGDKSYWQRQEFLCLTGQLDLCKPPVAPVQTAAVTSLPTPSAPVLTAGNTQNTLTWASVSGATSYNLVYKTSAGVTKSNGTILTSVTSPYTHSGLVNNTSYYYVVVAKSDTAESDVSPESSATPFCSPCRMFVTASSYDGARGGISGSDAKCNADSSKPASPSAAIYKAFLMDDTSRIACVNSNCSTGIAEHKDWILKPDTIYTRAEDGLTVNTTNSLGIWTTGQTNDAISGGSLTLMSGINTSGWTTRSGVSSHCTQWTSNASASPATFTTGTMNVGSISGNCNAGTRIVCVEQ
ncbi:DUF1554 domain-containing protein [Leptospira ognonensis]|nr:DUF1554 domain-containing protein [Leptospira ognonensis]